MEMFHQNFGKHSGVVKSIPHGGHPPLSWEKGKTINSFVCKSLYNKTLCNYLTN